MHTGNWRIAHRTVRTVAAAALTALVLPAGASFAQEEGRANAAEAAMQQRAATTFRLLTFEVGTSGPRLGTTRGNGTEEIVDVHNAIRYLKSVGEARAWAPIPIDMLALVEAGGPSIEAVKSVHRAITRVKAGGTFKEPGGNYRVFHAPATVKYLPPILNPSKIFGLAGNYIRRTPEGKPGAFDFVEYPSAFLKPPSAQVGHNTEINLEGLLTTGVHEPEMAIIVAKKATNVPESEAMDYVMGYTVHNDVSSRDLKMGRHSSQGSTISKGLDTFAPTGPYITLKEDVPNPHNLPIVGIVNGKPWPIPNANTSFLTWTIAQHIAYLSERITLLPGDIIATGVPGPVMVFKEGDVVELTIGHLGTLKSTVVSKPVPGHKIFPPRVVPKPSSQQ
jgi:2-keto-4-pentenoate hydratase/2-oxohepta-3-ene-1,7-dioic acid hydratase in catechol pathway